MFFRSIQKLITLPTPFITRRIYTTTPRLKILFPTSNNLQTTTILTSVPILVDSNSNEEDNRKLGTRYPFNPSTTTSFRYRPITQRTTITTLPKISYTIPFTTTQRYVTTTTNALLLDYCKLLNCDFNGL